MITLSIPTYNRVDILINSFIDVVFNDKISEIVIVDDCSSSEIYNSIIEKINNINSPKIKIYKNDNNLGSFFNKKRCVELSSNNWIILLDSDNKISNDYIESININSLEENILYLPSHAICHSPFLDYREYSNKVIEISEYKIMCFDSRPKIQCILNTGNYFFNRKTYLKAINNELNIIDSYAMDAYYMIYLFYKNINNFKMKIVENMIYYHHLHNDSNNGGSHFERNSNNNEDARKNINKMILNL